MRSFSLAANYVLLLCTVIFCESSFDQCSDPIPRTCALTFAWNRVVVLKFLCVPDNMFYHPVHRSIHLHDRILGMRLPKHL